MKKFNNKGFSLTELLIALSVVAILAVILLPVVDKIRPDQNLLMAKRVYHTWQTAVSKIMNDDSCYPDRTAECIYGYMDYSGYDSCTAWPASKHEMVYNSASKDWFSSTDSRKKFLAILKDVLGAKAILGDKNINGEDVEVFQSQDGVYYVVEGNGYWGRRVRPQYIANDGEIKDCPTDSESYNASNLSDGTSIGRCTRMAMWVWFDVNGSKGPNCSQKDDTTSRHYFRDSENPAIDTDSNEYKDACKDRTKGFDRGGMIIFEDGVIWLSGSDYGKDWMRDAILNTRNITNEIEAKD